MANAKPIKTLKKAKKKNVSTKNIKKSNIEVKKYRIHLVSDSTGNLAGHIINSVMTQFSKVNFEKLIHRFIDDDTKIKKMVDTFRKDGDVVFHAFTNTQSKIRIRSLCHKKGIPNFDLTGSLVNFLSHTFNIKPDNEKATLHPQDPSYFDRVQAMEFTAQHDDSRRLESIKEADIIILGISRVSKSPTSTFLGSMGFKVANVSVTSHLDIKKELRGIKRKTVALTIQAKVLQEIRSKRFSQFKIEKLDYMNLKDIIEEIVMAEEQYTEMGFPIIDVTNKTIEEISAEILDVKKLKAKYKH